MPRKTVEDYRQENQALKDQVAELESENEVLNDKLDSIADALGNDENDEGLDDGDGDEYEDDDFQDED